jgi:hypothetical protein
MRALTIRGPAGLRVSIAVAAVAVAALSAGVVWTARHGGGVPTPGDSGDVVEVGVVEGQSIPAYLDASRRELAAMADPSAPPAGDTWALASLEEYVPPDRLPALLGGAGVAQVYARVPLPGVRTQVVRIPVYRLPGDVTAGMAAAAQQRDQEQAEYLQLSAKTSGEGPSAQRARLAYDAAARAAGAEATAYRSGCACVFAAVIRAAPAVLQQIADRSGVRVVDPAPEVHSLDSTEFRAPLPEQSGTVPDEPSQTPTPVPTGPPGIASPAATPIMSSLGLPVKPVKSDSPRGSVPVAPDPVVSHPVVSHPVASDPSATAPEERSAVASAPGASAAHAVPSTSPVAS